MRAEQIVSAKIDAAFSLMTHPDKQWIEARPYLFERIPAQEAALYMPAFMLYILETMRDDPGSLVYMGVLYALNDYSKYKGDGDEVLGFWTLLSIKQKDAVMAFLQHLLHNQPASIDGHTLEKIIARWQRAD